MALTIKDQDENNETFLVHELARQIRVSFDRRAQHIGLTRSQWRALSVLRRFPGISQAVLAEHMEIEPISLVRLLDRMQKSGWIERRPDPNDRRANQLFLTKKVQKIVDDMREVAIGVRKDVLKGFTELEHEALLTYLRRMKSNVAEMMNNEA